MMKRKKVIEANIAVHTAAADRYREEPHYRPENRARVREILASIQKATGGERLLDLGCGMGFVIDIAKEFFPFIRGVDVTPAMLSCVDTCSDSSDIKVIESSVEEVPFDDASFDVCTSYAVLHHLEDINHLVKEACRVLKPGGAVYTDLDPNSTFWRAIKELDPSGDYPEAIRREICAVGAKDQEISEKFALDLSTVQLAEHWMHLDGGFDASVLETVFRDAGFSSVQVLYHWFVGEAFLVHNPEAEAALNGVRDYLQSMKPLTSHLYKYIGVIAYK